MRVANCYSPFLSQCWKFSFLYTVIKQLSFEKQSLTEKLNADITLIETKKENPNTVDEFLDSEEKIFIDVYLWILEYYQAT